MTAPRTEPLSVTLAQFEGATTMRVLPLAAGLLAATVRKTPDLARTRIRLVTMRQAPDRVADEVASSDVLGLSLYTWNERYALEIARRAKAWNRALIVVAGGPSAPRRARDIAAFFAAEPAVDVLVAGEGERVFVDVLRALQAGGDVRALAGIAGVSVRAPLCDPESPVAIAERGPRLTGDDFAAIGSPYLDGTFDALLDDDPRGIQAAVFETNRGCPFACTFCDWGQAIESRVHELPFERVEGELRWAAERRIPYAYFVDANFGIRRRDTAITEALGRIARASGYPRFVYFHLTKNATEKNLATVEALLDAGIGTQVSLSMQDFDPGVLAAIRRDNIHPERALALRERCHARGLPTTNELLLGLPAQTPASFRASLVSALTPFPGDSFFLYTTRVLINAEMAEPAYRARWGLVTRIVPAWPSDPADDPQVLEREEIVVGSEAMPLASWREAFAFGYFLVAIAGQRLLQTTLHVLRWALEADVAAWIERLLGAPGPRLSAIRAELGRHADAILAEEAATLPVAGFGAHRRGPGEAVVARALEDWPGFAAEVAEVTAAFVPELATLVRDAVAWDRFGIPERCAHAGHADFGWDWAAYGATMGVKPAPIARPIRASRRVPEWTGAEPARHLEMFLALGWAKEPRIEIAVDWRDGD